MSVHRLDLIAKLLDLKPTDHPTTGPVILGDEHSEENYELDAVLEVLVRRLINAEHQAHEALWSSSQNWKTLADLKAGRPGALDAVQAYVKEAGL